MRRFRLLLFDRDGTLTYENRRYHRDLLTLPSYPFAGPTLQDLAAAGYHLAVVTNQSGIAHGYWPLEAVQALHERFCREWGVTLPFYICPHHPDEGCQCRKPGASLLQQAMTDCGIEPGSSLMIGDSMSDYGAAQAAGVGFALVLTGRGRVTDRQLPTPPAMVLDTIAGLREYCS
ncbi:MAG: D-glycero-alpha-D-manno-heptose-1,7-bisphosphate 7-phosphatase [Candidatus Neomarinimicrobiota bacterium]